MKKKYLRIVTLLLSVCLLAGCGAAVPQETLPDDVDAAVSPIIDFSVPTFPALEPPTAKFPLDDVPEVVVGPGLPLRKYNLVTDTTRLESPDGDMRYVMIYNPYVYDENNPYSNFSFNTGSFASQVEVDLNRGGLDTLPEMLGLDQGQLNADLPLADIVQESDRAGFYPPVYSQGDTRSFFCYDNTDLDNPRISREFTCAYAGTHCYVWIGDSSMSTSLAQKYGEEFDTYVYDAVSTYFGQPRFAEDGSKVHLMFYPMPSYIGGCFCLLDLFSSSEVTTDDIFTYGLNPDHPTLHMNADFTAYDHMQTYMRSTMAHEFQHMIAGTNVFSTLDFNVCDTWLNEAMSGYIEETLYPGVKEESSGHLSAFLQSDRIRNGLSMYNFFSDGNDCGVYGSVYLYAEYLSALAGEDVFANIHDYWRNSYSSTLSVPEALVNSVPQDVYEAVDTCVPYPPVGLVFRNQNERWLSKLTLQFYLELLHLDANDPAAFGAVIPEYLLYNEINPATLEAGGRIIVALSGNSYQIPADADTGLIYIGLNKDFEPVTDLVFHTNANIP